MIEEAAPLERDRLSPLLDHPQLAVLAEGLRVRAAPVAGAWRCAVGADDVVVDPQGATLLGVHFAIELALWRRLDPDPDTTVVAAHLLAAAHATESFARLLPRQQAEDARAAAPCELTALMAAAAAEVPTAPAAIVAAGFALMPGDLAAPDDVADAWRIFAALRPVAAPAAALMLRQSDSRLDPSPDSGVNRYGCGPLPEARGIALSSSTASPLSLAGLRAAEALRRRFMAAARGDLTAMVTYSAQRIKTAILDAFNLDDVAVPVLASSGTTATLLATAVATGRAPARWVAVLLGPEESGSGIPVVAAGRHPSPRSPGGATLPQDAPVAGFTPEALRVEALPIRDAAGVALSPAQIEHAVANAVATATAQGERVMLHVLEGSKAGLVTPGLDSVLALKRRFPDLAVIVDACQMRAGRPDLRRYVAAGCMVVTTGSKFFGGPAFSAVLLLPANTGDGPPLPAGLADYSWRGDWPAAWPGRCGALPTTANPGLVLRWQAALAEIAAFDAVPEDAVGAAVAAFGDTVRDLAGAPFQRCLPREAGSGDAWWHRPSIACFAVRHPREDRWLDGGELGRLYARLTAQGCLIGQPIPCRAGDITAALRIALGARQIVAVAEHGPAALRRDVGEVLETLRQVLPHLFGAEAQP